jgi:hypothetical protein
MTDNDIKQFLNDNNYHISKSNEIQDKKCQPKCPNHIFQYLLLKRKNKEDLNPYQDYVYGSALNSLVHILMKNKHFCLQTPEIQDECRLEMLCAIPTIENGFDPTKGKAYSYAFRIFYTEGIHVLERWNEMSDLFVLASEIEDEDMKELVTTNL